MTKILEFQLQHQSFHGVFRVDFTWLTDLISLLSKGLSKIFSSTIVWKHQLLSALPSLWFNSHICTWLLEKPIALTIWIFVGKVMSLLFNMLSRFVIAFLPRTKHLLILWLQSLSAMILRTQENKICHCFHFSPIYLSRNDGTGCHDLSFFSVEF